MQKIASLSCFAVCSFPLFAQGEALVWSENFDSPLDPSIWRIVEGNGCPSICGYGNNELQTYTSDQRNLRVENGKLVIEAHKDTIYSSAKITTQNLPGWTYGKISVRAKLPSGVGTWPAIWMLPDNNTYGSWPKSGEIDIMEHVGFNEGHVHGTIHTEAYNHKIGTQKGGEILLPTATTSFHTYTVDWDAQSIRWYIDGKPYYQFEKHDGDTVDEWPFDDPFHLILNLAVGGDWGGKEGVDATSFPARFEIDWVKVWKKADD